jgi:hypothetical protein
MRFNTPLLKLALVFVSQAQLASATTLRALNDDSAINATLVAADSSVISIAAVAFDSNTISTATVAADGNVKQVTAVGGSNTCDIIQELVSQSTTDHTSFLSEACGPSVSSVSWSLTSAQIVQLFFFATQPADSVFTGPAEAIPAGAIAYTQFLFGSYQGTVPLTGGGPVWVSLVCRNGAVGCATYITLQFTCSAASCSPAEGAPAPAPTPPAPVITPGAPTVAPVISPPAPCSNYGCNYRSGSSKVTAAAAAAAGYTAVATGVAVSLLQLAL